MLGVVEDQFVPTARVNSLSFTPIHLWLDVLVSLLLAVGVVVDVVVVGRVVAVVVRVPVANELFPVVANLLGIVRLGLVLGAIVDDAFVNVARVRVVVGVTLPYCCYCWCCVCCSGYCARGVLGDSSCGCC